MASTPAPRQDSKQPVQPLHLAAQGFDEQVDELLVLITPTAECERVVQDLAQKIKALIRKHWPSASVIGIVSGDISQSTSFGVAVPEVDIIVKLRNTALASPLQARLSRANNPSNQADLRKLQKSAIRVCTDLLVSEGGFKFRRSAFRGKEPKVTLLVPRSAGYSDQNIPLDFSVNASTPLCNAALLSEIGWLEPRARALALLVRRWAKDRGICHAAKGHLPPYAWTLLTIYYLQVGVDGKPLLPPLTHPKTPTVAGTGIWDSEAPSTTAPPDSSETTGKSVGELFKDFISFYLKAVDWKAEVISIRFGKRAVPGEDFPLHSVPRSDGSLELAPSIEDPFAPNQNIAECVTAAGIARLTEELERAQALNDSREPLTKLLEAWVPPEQPALRGEDEDEDEEQHCGGAPSCSPVSKGFPTSPPPGLEKKASPSKSQTSTKHVAPVHPWARRNLGHSPEDASWRTGKKIL